MYNNLKKLIEWMIELTSDRMLDFLDITGQKENWNKELFRIKQDLQTDDLHQLVMVKNQVRRIYKQLTSFYTSDAWQAPGLLIDSDILLAGHMQKEINRYNRIHDNPILSKTNQQFESEFYKEYDNSLTFLTNSGMSALTLGGMLCNYLHGKGSILIQDEQYYEMTYLIKAVFNECIVLPISQIYNGLAADDVIRCIAVGCAPHKNNEDVFDMHKFLQCLQNHKQRETMIVILDRTYFSTIDDYPNVLKNYNFDKNIVFVSGESLNKNHQYGLDIINLGYCRIDSQINPILKSLGFADKIYSAATMRPEMTALMEIFPFHQTHTVNRFDTMCRNTKFLFEEISNLEYDTMSICSCLQANETSYGNVMFVHFPIDYNKKEEQLIQILKNQQTLVLGTSFGYDLTRAEYIGLGKDKMMLRISVGIESESDIITTESLY